MTRKGGAERYQRHVTNQFIEPAQWLTFTGNDAVLRFVGRQVGQRAS